MANSCRTPNCEAPPTADHRTLHNTSDSGLIDALLILTHKVHAVEETAHAALPNPLAAKGATHLSSARAANDLRRQRDLVRGEILRRMA